MNEDLQKYEAELISLNKQLTELDERKTNILRQGYRIEGIVAYIRAKQNEKKDTAVTAEAEVA